MTDQKLYNITGGNMFRPVGRVGSAAMIFAPLLQSGPGGCLSKLKFSPAIMIYAPFLKSGFGGWPGRKMAPAAMILTLLLFAGCGSCEREEAEVDPGPRETYIYGTITVDETLDATRDYSGITLLVRDYIDIDDTVFHAVTNSNGHFDGTARFPRQNYYELVIYRNERRIDDTTLVLAHQDTVHIEGMLPRFAGQARFTSTEHEALSVLNRLERQYNRIIGLATIGAIPQDTIPYILDQWSDLYWNVFESWPETLAAQSAAGESLRMLEERNDEKLMRRLQEYGDHEYIRRLASRFGFLTKIRLEGLDAGIAWLDSLEMVSERPETRRQIAMSRIEVLYDSARTEEAQRRVLDFQDRYGEDMEVEAWLQAMRYDIEYLSAGEPLPFFEIEVQYDGETYLKSLDDLQGSPAVIDVARLTDRDYQFYYDDLRMVHFIYQGEGVRFLTLPVEENPVIVRAFYEEREQDWPVAVAGAYAESNLEERWNVFETPVRFVIDSNGRIARKIHGHNTNEIIHELNKLLMNGEVL